jgi:hypothetical protein
MAAARSSGRYVALDAAETLAQFMVDGRPDEERFARVVGGQIEALAARNGHVQAFGEMVALLHADGNGEAAIALEKLWNALAARHSFSLHCAYPLHAFSHHSQTAQFLDVCAEHSAVIPAEGFAEPTTPDAHDRTIVELQQKTLALSTEIDGTEARRRRCRKRSRSSPAPISARTNFSRCWDTSCAIPCPHPLGAADPAVAGSRCRGDPARPRKRSRTRRAICANIVDDLLDATRVSTGKIELRSELVDLASVIQRAIDVTSNLVESKHHRVLLAMPAGNVLVRGDATRLEQIFVNLLTNAAKYMAAHGRIVIRANVRDDEVEVEVEDEGMGLSAEIRLDCSTCSRRKNARSIVRSVDSESACGWCASWSSSITARSTRTARGPAWAAASSSCFPLRERAKRSPTIIVSTAPASTRKAPPTGSSWSTTIATPPTISRCCAG